MALGFAVMKTLLCNFFMSERSLLAPDLSLKPHFRRQPAGKGIFKGETMSFTTVSTLNGG